MNSPGVVLFLSILGLGDAISGSTCPDGAIQIIQGCIGNSLPSFQPSQRSIESEIEILRKACRDSSVTKASDCVKNVMDKCKGFTDEEQNVQRLFSHENIRKIGSYFCTNFDLYVNNIRCVTSQHRAAINCSRPQMESFRRKIIANSPIEVMILSSCLSHQVMTECLLDPVYTNCGGSAAMFLEEVSTLNRPPVCQPLTPKYKHLQSDDPNGNSANSVTSATTWLSILNLILLIKI